MGGRLDVVKVELLDRRDVVEHARQLDGHAVDLLVAQLQPREARHVADLLALDHPDTATPRNGRSSRSDHHAAASTPTHATSASQTP